MIEDYYKKRPIWPYHRLDQRKSWVQRILGDSSIFFRGAHPPSQDHFAQSLSLVTVSEQHFGQVFEYSLHASAPLWRKLMSLFKFQIQIFRWNFPVKVIQFPVEELTHTVWGAFPSRKSLWKFRHSLEKPVRLNSKPIWNWNRQYWKTHI